MPRVAVSRNRWGPILKHLDGKVLNQMIDDYGYSTVSMSRNGSQKPYRVHRLVGEAFLGPRQPGQDTRHGPNGLRDNSVQNLRYGTRAENEQDKVRDGTFNHGGGEATAGEKNGNARLTEPLVTEIRKRHAAGQRQKDLASAFGVTQATISQVVTRKTWKHLP